MNVYPKSLTFPCNCPLSTLTSDVDCIDINAVGMPEYSYTRAWRHMSTNSEHHIRRHIKGLRWDLLSHAHA